MHFEDPIASVSAVHAIFEILRICILCSTFERTHGKKYMQYIVHAIQSPVVWVLRLVILQSHHIVKGITLKFLMVGVENFPGQIDLLVHSGQYMYEPVSISPTFEIFSVKHHMI